MTVVNTNGDRYTSSNGLITTDSGWNAAHCWPLGYTHPYGCCCAQCRPVTIYTFPALVPEDLERKALEELAAAVRAAKTRTADVQRALDLLDGIKRLRSTS